MKILVDELPFDTNECPFNYGDSWGYSLCPCRNDEDKCPEWRTSKDNLLHECERLIEYDEFMRRQGGKVMDNYIVINGKKTELTEEQLKQLGIETKEKRNNPFEG